MSAGSPTRPSGIVCVMPSPTNLIRRSPMSERTRPGRDAVHAHAGARHLLGDDPHQRVHARLRHVVGRAAGRGHVGADRRDEEQHAAASREAPAAPHAPCRTRRRDRSPARAATRAGSSSCTAATRLATPEFATAMSRRPNAARASATMRIDRLAIARRRPAPPPRAARATRPRAPSPRPRPDRAGS